MVPQLVPNDSHDWDLTRASPMFRASVNGATRRLVVTAGKGRVLRALDRETHGVLYETAVTTRENADTPVVTTPTRACPGVLGGTEWNGPAYNPGTNMLYVPAVDWCATFTAYEQMRYIPGKGTWEDRRSRSAGESARLGDRDRRIERRREMEVPLATPDGRRRHHHRGKRADHRGADGRFPGSRRADGDVLYRFNTGGSMGGGIVTYAVGGKQYIAAASGSPSNFWVDKYPGSPTVVVFKLP